MTNTWTEILTADLFGEAESAVLYQLSTWGNGEFDAGTLSDEFGAEVDDIRAALAAMPRSDSYARESLARIEAALTHITRTLAARSYPDALPIR